MRTFTAFMLLALFATPVHAYDIGDLRRDMRAHFGRMMEHLGDVTFVQEATFEGGQSGMAGMTATTRAKGSRWRSDAVMKGKEGAPDMEVTTLFDGTDTWSVTMGMKHKLPRGAASRTGTGGLWNELPEGATLTGEAKVAGRDCWQVEFEAEKGAPKASAGPVRLSLDKSTFMPVEVLSESFGQQTRVVMSDFRKVKGYEIPHLTEVFTGEQKTMTAKIVKLETGKGLSDDLFDSARLAGEDAMDASDMMKKALEMQKQMEQLQKGDR